MPRAPVVETRRATSTGQRARLELALDVVLKRALAHAAVERGITIAALVAEALHAHPDVSKFVDKNGVDTENV
jgi:hypothetical protein